jgi:hypothetical protein
VSRAVAVERISVELDPAIVEDSCGALEAVDGDAPSRAVRGQLLVSEDGDAVFVPEEVVVHAQGREEVVPLDGSTPAFGRALAKGWLRGLPGVPSQVPKALVPRPQNRARESRPQRRAAARSSSSGGDDPPDDEPPGPDLATWRGFSAASVRMVRHCARRRAKAAA